MKFAEKFILLSKNGKFWLFYSVWELVLPPCQIVEWNGYKILVQIDAPEHLSVQIPFIRLVILYSLFDSNY